MTAPALPPLMVSADDAAALIGVSPATWHRMVAAGKTPAPVRLSKGCVRYRTADLQRWCEAGCPDRKTWEADEHGRPAR
ncbi:MAG: DNA-binding protein [Planctomycetota bacterium]|nr:MAG: DNA-binding protein [Planctomycetota bacterium]REK30653.1 MAG: DNA-binding protein [Planctomycetota bacterium]REK33027.1 MAG: DNA-binding protein [Planctomycetota bacterium]